MNHYAKLASTRITVSAFQTNHLTYAMVDDDIFAFFRFPDEEDAEDPAYLVAINFGDEDVTRDFVAAANEAEVDLSDSGTIRISSGMDKNDQETVLNQLPLASGEALVIQVEATKRVEPTSSNRPPTETPTPDGASRVFSSALLAVVALLISLIFQ